MKNRWIVAACAAVCWTASAQTTAPYAPAPENLQARTAFQDAKFGIFLHWGLYSMLGSGEWTMTNRNINYQEPCITSTWREKRQRCQVTSTYALTMWSYVKI